MSQAPNFGVPNTGPSTPAAFAGRINESLQALRSSHAGNSRPSYAEGGTIWTDQSGGSDWQLKFFDGSDDILLGTIDTTANTFILAEMAGVIKEWAGSDLPKGYLWCAGQAVSRTTYPALFAALGTIHGEGDGSTTFNVPDRRGRVGVGRDNMGGTPANRVTSGGSGIAGNVLGEAGGSQTVTLTKAQMPAHDHGGYTGNAGAHDHDVTDARGVGTRGSGGITDVIAYSFGSYKTSMAPDHRHTITSEGGGSSHSNVQPAIICNYIIKAH